jgi:hypothetical protein
LFIANHHITFFRFFFLLFKEIKYRFAGRRWLQAPVQLRLGSRNKLHRICWRFTAVAEPILNN